MDKTQLTFKMLEWEMKRKELDELETEITEVVLERQKTYDAGNVRATYSKGRTSYDYRTPGLNADPEVIDQNTQSTEVTNWESLARAIGATPLDIAHWTKTEKTTNWRDVCKVSKIDGKFVSRTAPSVKLKLLG